MNILNESIQYVKGVGPYKAAQLKKMNIENVEDMLYHFPRDYDDRSTSKKISQLQPGEKITVYGEISTDCKNRRVRNGFIISKFYVKDDTGRLQVTFFNQPYLKNKFKIGQKIMLNGKIKKGFDGLEIINPVYEIVDSIEGGCTNGIVPVYSTTEGLSQNQMISIQRELLKSIISNIEEYLPEEIIKKNRLCDIQFALRQIHFPSSVKSLKVAKYRLVFEELFLLQIGLMRMKKVFTEDKEGIPLVKEGGLDLLVSKLPFELTKAQKRTLEEIIDDLEKPIPMNRLVQGDVGSGKTIIAILALYKCINNGYQGAFMAPTEILAEQHYYSLKEILEPLGVKIGLLVGSLSRSKKEQLIKEISEGKIQIIVGTHALIQEGVDFKNLALVITDEQHRFGVRQRAVLANKGKNPHILVMTATPIPRTLALILYGDLDISIIDQLPPGRKPVETSSITDRNKQECYGFVKKQLDLGRQAYIVCPLVEESESIEAQSATEMAEEFSRTLFQNYRVGLLHGKMNAKEKEDVMTRFKEGLIDVLVSTTVIEVGVNVPNATVMVIENAERFGLAQLHQLRGRVGRGSHQSYCILINNSKSDIAKERMDIMVKTNDGFIISEKDLELRGPGDFFGTRQHGLPELKIANIFKHMQILKKVENEVEMMLREDPHLKLDKYPLLRVKLEEKFNRFSEELIYT